MRKLNQSPDTMSGTRWASGNYGFPSPTHSAAQVSGFTHDHHATGHSLGQRPAGGLWVLQARGQPYCHTCMESALTISPPSRWPNCNARVDLPVPVAPRITTRGSVRGRPRSREPAETARAAAAAAILKKSAPAQEQLSPWQPSERLRITTAP